MWEWWERGSWKKIHKKEGAPISESKAQAFECVGPGKGLPIGCKALDKSIKFFESYKHMAYKMRVIPLKIILHGHYVGPMKKMTARVKMVPMEGILRK